MLRLKMKVYTDPETQKRYLAAAAAFHPDGYLVTTVMSDDHTKVVRLLPDQWNALPYFYFKEDGAAERPKAKWDPVAGKESAC